MLRLLVVFSFSLLALQALPPPPGLALKPAKQLDEDETLSSPPPNLSLRSRMMAAINSEKANLELPLLLSQPLILKRKKLKNYTKAEKPTTVTVAVVTTPRPPPSSTIRLPPSADYGVTSLLKTNFVDKKGKIHNDVISIPIPIGDGSVKKTVSASSTLVESESQKAVQVRFGPAPLRKKL